MFLIALVCGGFAASKVTGRMREVEAAVGAPVGVLVAVRDIAPGAELRRADLAVREVPERFAPPDALVSPNDVVGLSVPSPLTKGAYLTSAAFARSAGQEEGGASGALRRGERAVQVAVAGAGALGESMVPGARVDVLVSTEAREGPGRTLLALEDVELLDLGAVDGAAPAEGEGAAGSASRSATLRVTLSQAVYLTAAQNFAREVRLLPRPPGDRRRAGREVVAADGL